MGIKSKNTLRIYSQNVNGIPVEHIEEAMTKNLDVMMDRQVNIMGWSETNLGWNSYPIHLKTQQIYKKQFPGRKWITATSSIPSETNLKPGGNSLGLNRDTNAQTNMTGKDDMGRWIWATLEGRTGSVTVVQLYLPGETSKQGITTTYAQQYEQLLLKFPEKTPQVLKQYYTNLTIFLNTLDTHLILMGDFNEGPHGKNILDLQTKHNLRNVYNHRYPNQPLNTHQMGTLRINQFLVSAPLLPHIVYIGYKALDTGIPLDHQGMFLDIQRQALTNHSLAPRRTL